MSSRPFPIRLTVVTVTLALGLVATVACSGDDTPASTTTSGSDATTTAVETTVTDATTTTTEDATGATGTAAPPILPEDAIVITVEGGVVAEGGGRASVALGDTVVLAVTTDVSDEVHVHGYDLFADTRPGEMTTLEFAADIPGVFEVELEGAGLPLAELEVQ